LTGVAWSTYESLLADLAGESAPRLTYDEGVLELMMPLAEHEQVNRTLALLIEIFAEESRIDVCNFGSATFHVEALRRGFEPDSCFYIQNEPVVRGKNRLDLAVDPPPDLGIEIEITSGAIRELHVYAAMGVPEVWRYDGDRLRMFELEGGTYSERSHSRAFPHLTAEAMTDWLARGSHVARTTLLRDFRAWVRALTNA
ncbi:MAG: Uma2 family endonuclease, partial [Vicinamibacterales bacterium]